MKVIDLLNKIANGEEVPKKVFYKTGGEYTGGYYWNYDESYKYSALDTLDRNIYQEAMIVRGNDCIMYVELQKPYVKRKARNESNSF